ncbi:MAG TPA: hypothetical protein VL307_09145 [Chitinophagaceae bacterium]|nr:hypothetical protein [Chitinophagaceae bacterium]
MNILVFKTDVRSRKKVSALAPYLQNIQGIIKWNVDLHDADKVLRVECAAVPARLIEQRLKAAGHYCKEL